MIHSFSERFKTKKRSLVAASSLGKWPLARTARRSLELSASMAGLSGISCAAGRVNGLGQSDCEALAEQDGELRLGHGPLARRHDPLLLGSVQDQEEEFGRGLVAGEMAPGPDRPAQLGIERLDGVCRIQNPADITGEGIERDDLRPGPPPALTDGRVFLSPKALLEGAERGFPGLGIDGPVNALQRRRHGLAVLQET